MAVERKLSKKMPEPAANIEQQAATEKDMPLWRPRPHLDVEDDQPLDEKDQPILEYQPDLRNVLFLWPPTTGRH